MTGFARPGTLAELLRAARDLPGRVHYLAGGTDLAVQRRAGSLPEAHTLCLWGLPELTGIEERGATLRIGACTTVAEILAAPAVRDGLPLLCDSLAFFASPQIRSMATLGGNICNGSPTADTVPPLLVLDAEVEIAHAEGTRLLPLASFFTGYKRNVLRQGEIVAAVLVHSGRLDGYRCSYRKVGARATMTIAKLSVALAWRPRGVRSGAPEDLCVAVGSLTEYPRRLWALEDLLRGRDPADVGAARIEEAVRSEITPISDFRSDADYRAQACVNLIRGFLGVAGGEEPPQSAVPE